MSVAAVLPTFNSAVAGNAMAVQPAKPGSWLSDGLFDARYGLAFKDVPGFGPFEYTFAGGLPSLMRKSIAEAGDKSETRLAPGDRAPDELAASYVVPPRGVTAPIDVCFDRGGEVLWHGRLNPRTLSTERFEHFPTDLPKVTGYSPCEVWTYMQAQKLDKAIEDARAQASVQTSRALASATP